MARTRDEARQQERQRREQQQREQRDREFGQPHHGHGPNGHDKPIVPFFDLAHASVQRWAERELPTLEFTVGDLIPHETAWLIGGDSGSGKSILMQTLCTCVAADIPFLGRAVRHGRAVYLTGEDRDDILHSRQLRIFQALGISWADVGDNLLVRSRADAEMWLFNERGPTAHGYALVDEIKALGGKTSLGVIDSASLTFDAEEIKRRPVADFMRYLNRSAVDIGGSIGLVAHTSRSSKGDARSMVSGSTAWVAQARAGLLLEAGEKGEAKLSLIAPNYSRPVDPISLEWTDDGVLMLPSSASGGMVANITQRKHDDLVFTAIKAAWEGGGDPLNAKSLPGYMAGQGKMKQHEAKAAMLRLRGDAKIATDRKGRGATGFRPVVQAKLT